MIPVNSIMFRYLVREFLTKFALFFVVLLGIIYIFEVIELIQQASGQSNISIHVILSLSLYKLPDVGQQIFPFIILFSAIATFRNLSDRHELVCIRASGVSVWQFTMPIITATFILGLLYISVFNPLSAASLARHEALKTMHFNQDIETITVIDDGLWIRQEDKTGNFILKSDTVNAKNWSMKNVTVFFFDKDNIHSQRIDAKTAQLSDNEWIFKNVTVHQTNAPAKFLPELSLSTTLTSQTISESFSNPETIAFWRLPHFISALGATGLDTTEMQIYYQTLLSQPLFLISMVLLAGAITLRTNRVTSLLPVISGALGFGFIVFFMSGFLRALSMGQDIPIILAVWSSPIIIILATVTYLIRLEDG